MCGLMLGNAGIGHVYLRLADPALGCSRRGCGTSESATAAECYRP
jgi:hypothetical protein